MRHKIAGGHRSYDTNVADRIAFPMGGIGAGMLCLEGSGALFSACALEAKYVEPEPILRVTVGEMGSGTPAWPQ